MPNCSRCGKELSSVDTPCDKCTKEFESYEFQLEISKPIHKQRTKICPYCGELFSPVELHFTFYPYDAKWYSPKKPEFSCPHCFGYIKSKYKLNTILALSLPLIVIISNKYLGLYGLFVGIPCVILLVFLLEKSRKDPYEFVKS
jgi:DNA-directed RNA polymerase subunit RPC12/RpoP